MDLIDRLRELAVRIPNNLNYLTTEEATKTALVMPFIDALGYNLFDPTEVVPEFTADVGTKKGEKVDYAILREGHPVILFECKKSGCDLDQTHASQLYRYFSVTPARFGVLTNGVDYRFFSDLEEPNKMDSRPFFEFSLLEIDEKIAGEIKKFAKQTFDLEDILSTASDLKYTKGVRRLLGEEYLNPSEKFVRLFAGRVYSGHLTQTVKEQFTQIVRRAFHEFMSSRINERLQSALERSDMLVESEDEVKDADNNSSKIEPDRSKPGVVTTEEEIEGFYIVKAVLADTIDPGRVFMRDTLKFCGILLDDTNRKPVCRLWFNDPQKYLGVFDENKRETKYPIEGTNGIYHFAKHIRQAAVAYDKVAGKHDEPGE